jgi:[protein-PII] uridylyltransferase
VTAASPAEARARWAEARAEAIRLALEGHVRKAAAHLTHHAENAIAEAFAAAAHGTGAARRIAVLTVGGTARREMAPWSDVDIAVILPGAPSAEDDTLIANALRTLYDAGQPIGAVIRTLDTIATEAAADLRNATAMLRMRRVWGAASIESAARGRMEAFLRSGDGSALRDGITEQIRAARRLDDTACLLEPDLKESRGGLRDIHRLRWLAEVDEARGATPPPAMARETARALDTLLRLRFALHSAAGRKHERLDFEHQLRVCELLRVTPHGAMLAEERLMREYYGAAQAVDMQCMRALLEPDGGDAPREAATWPIDIFTHAAREGRALRLGELDRAREAAATWLPERTADPRFGEAFMALLAVRRGTFAALEQMHAHGVLCAYLPEFRLIERLPRIDHYHAYTVDEHSLRAVLAFEDLLAPDRCFARPAVAEIARRLLRPDLLKLALLFHDVGKGEGRGHVRRGAHMMARIAERMGLSRHETEIVRALVDNHQRMTWMITRRDPEDPASAKELADGVGDAELLRMLFIHTVCDLRAVSPTSFNDWRGDQLFALHESALRILRREPVAADDASALSVRDLAARFEADGGPPAADAARFLAHMPERYRRFPSAQELALHMGMAASLGPRDRVRIRLGRRESETVAEIVFAALDSPGLFAQLCAGVSSLRLNIQSAQIFTGSDGICIDVFRVQAADAARASLGEDVLGRLEAKLNRILTGQQEPHWPTLRTRGPRKSRASLEQRPPKVEFDNATAPRHTILRVTAPDRPGLLAAIAEFFHRQRLLVDLALIWTEGYQIVDTFYVTDIESNKLTGPATLARIEEGLLDAVRHPDDQPPPKEEPHP